MRTRQGFTLVEMLVAMLVFLIVLAGALSFLMAQSRSFRRGSDEMAILQNLSFGVDNLDHQIRTAGSNTLDAQPPVIYASASAFAFNADYASNDASDLFAVYVDADAPAGEVEALDQSEQITIPGSSPAFAYPSTDYRDAGGINSSAETISFFFTPDTETPRTDDFLLLRQVNDRPPEPLVRNVLPDGAGEPFFRYHKLRIPATGPSRAPVVEPVPAAQLPMAHGLALHGGVADAASAIDSLRAVQLTYAVTNGQTGADERRRRVSVNIPLPNMGLRQLKICGSEPQLLQALAAAYDGSTGTDRVVLTWHMAFDENAGEKDVVRYVLWRRAVADPDWGDPLTSVPAGQSNYLYVDTQALQPGETYRYQLAAQDCSPKLSAPSISGLVPIPVVP